MPEWKHMPLLYVWKNTDYVRIEDGNHMNASADLNTKDPSRVSWFKRVAARSKHRGVWETAFDQYKRTKFYPNDRTVDFSDTVEFLYILEIPKSVVRDEKDFANRYLK